MQWEKLTGIPNVVAGVKASLRAPMVADPGTRFNYGINTEWLGQVVEAVTGKTLDVAVKEGITGPLGMDHTTFLMTTSNNFSSILNQTYFPTLRRHYIKFTALLRA